MHELKVVDEVKKRQEITLFALPLGTQNRVFYQEFG